MPSPLLTYRGTVYPWHCDHVGHLNVMRPVRTRKIDVADGFRVYCRVQWT
jgi:hypothetical protein